jgi:PAS domain S-box-containing protein
MKKKKHPVDYNQQNFQTNLINSISDAVISTDTKFIITGWNKAAEQIYGWRQNEVIGLQAYTILGTRYPDGTSKEEAEKQFHEKGFWTGEIIQKRKDGVSVHISSSVTAINNDSGEIERVFAINRDINNRKLAEAEIEKTNERLRLALQASNSGTWDWDIERDTWYWSGEFLQLFGMNPETVAGIEVWLNAVHPDDRGIFTKGMQDALQQGTEWVSDYRITLPNGENRWIRITGKPFHSNDKPVRMTGLCKDVSRQKKAEETLRESEEKFRAIFENNSSAMLIVDENTTLVMVNEAFCHLVGCTHEEIIGTSWTRLLPPAEMERLKEYNRLRLINSEDAPDKYEFKFYRNNSELRDGLMFVSLFPGLKKVVGSFLDITERKKMEEALRESEKNLSNLYATMTEGLAVHEMIYNNTGKAIDYIITSINPSYEKITGFSQEQVVGKRATQVYGISSPPFIEIYEKVTASGNPEAFETYFPPMNKYFRISSFSPDKGKFVTVFGDITDRKNAENELRRSRQDLDRAQEVGAIGSWRLDIQKNVLAWSDENHRIFGIPTGTLMSYETLLSTVHPDDRNYLDIKWNEALKGAPYDIEHRIVVNGETKWVREKAYLEFDQDNNLLSGFGITQDITEHKRIEEALRESENRFRLALKNAPVSVAIQDKDLRFIWAYNQNNSNPDEMVGKTDHDLFPEDADLLEGLKLEVLKSGKEVSEKLWISGNGKKSFLDFHIEPLRNKEGAITGIGVATLDLTAMKLSEDALFESAATLKGILNATTESIWLFGTDGKILLGNQTALDRVGLPAEKLMGYNFIDLLPKNIAASRFNSMNQAAVLKQPVVMMDEQDGRHFEHTFYPVISSDGNINRIAAYSRDITRRIREEQAQTTLNRTFAALAKSSQAMARFTDEKLYLQEVCKIIAEDCGFAFVWIGYAADDEQKSILPIANAGFEDGYLDTIKLTWGDTINGRGPTGRAIRTGNMTMCTNMLTDPSFLPWRDEAIKRGYASSIVFPLKAENKTFGAISIYARQPDALTEDVIKLLSEMTSNMAHGITTIRLRKDRELAEIALLNAYDALEDLVKERTKELKITNTHLKKEINKRIQHEHSLSVAEEKYRTVANYTNDWESWLGPDGNFVYMSPSCFEITGYSEDEFLSNPDLYLSITHPEDSGMIKKHFDAKLKRKINDCSFDYRIINRDGEVRWMAHKCQPVYNSDGKWIGQRGSNRDITERKRAESLLIESQTQLRALAQKVNEVAEEERIHIAREIHDELGHLLTALKFDLENLTMLTETTAEAFKTETGALTNLVTTLIDTVRKISTELRPAVLDHLGLLPAIEWLISQFKSHTKIRCQFHPAETEVQFDKNETTNIFRIMQEVLTNIARHSQATHIKISLALKEDKFEIIVSDNGIGFNIEHFYHAGSIGLMGIRERAFAIGATVDFKSGPNKGAEMTLLLPGKAQ